MPFVLFIILIAPCLSFTPKSSFITFDIFCFVLWFLSSQIFFFFQNHELFLNDFNNTDFMFEMECIFSGEKLHSFSNGLVVVEYNFSTHTTLQTDRSNQSTNCLNLFFSHKVGWSAQIIPFFVHPISFYAISLTFLCVWFDRQYSLMNF